MANFLVISDPDDGRRAEALERAAPMLSFLPGLGSGRRTRGRIAVAWAAGAHAPVDAAGGAGDHGPTVVWGDALPAGGDGRISAAELAARISSGAPPPELSFDGFHAWVHGRPDGGIVLGADPVGLFPVYVWSDPDDRVLLAASAPSTLQAHPAFRPVLDPRGLAGVLLTNGLVGGRSLLRGVRRLPPGRLLDWRPGREPEELVGYEPRREDGLDVLPHRVLLDRMDRLLEETVARHVAPHAAAATMLSGGLDSRLLTGYGCRSRRDWTAVTLGDEEDLEYRCASRVARELGLEHRRLEHRPSAFPEGARIEAGVAGLSAGFSGVQGWAAPLGEAGLPPVMMTGLLGNAVLGLSQLRRARWRGAGEAVDVGPVVEALTRWGVPMEVLRETARPWFLEGHLEPLWAARRERLLPPGPSMAHRIWLLDLRHRQRFHVGGMAWRLSFDAWPTVPVTDRSVLDLVASCPVAALDGRRLQRELLRRRFPALARLPLDRNSFDTTPLEPGTADYVRQALARRLGATPPGRWWRRWRRGEERRYYYRVYDLGSEGWREVRRAAEPARAALEPLFDVEALTRSYLPPPDADPRLDDGIVDASGRKLLLGLMTLLGGDGPGRPPEVAAGGPGKAPARDAAPGDP